MNNALSELHKALTRAEVEYQQKFDALKNFDHELLSNPITNIIEILEQREKLEEEEREAYKKRKVAEQSYIDYLKRVKGK